MRPIISSSTRLNVSMSDTQSTNFDDKLFARSVARWKEKALAAGVKLAEEAERRLLLCSQHIDLSHLDLLDLPDDIALPPDVMMLDLSGNPQLVKLPECLFRLSEGMNVHIYGTPISTESLLCIQEQRKGVHFIAYYPVSEEDLSQPFSNDELDDILAQGNTLRQWANEIRNEQDQQLGSVSPSFSLKKNVSGLLHGTLLFMANFTKTPSWMRPIISSQSTYADVQTESDNLPGALTTYPISPTQFWQENHRIHRQKRGAAAGYLMLSSTPSLINRLNVENIRHSTVFDMVKLLKPNIVSQMSNVQSGIFEQGVIEDSEILFFVQGIIEYTTQTPDYIKKRIIDLWMERDQEPPDEGSLAFEKLFSVIKTLNRELGEEKAWQTTRNEFENIMYNLSNENNRKIYAQYEFKYTGDLLKQALTNITDDSMDIFVYVDKWISAKVMQYETDTGNKTFFTPNTTFALLNQIKKEPQLIHGRLRPDSDGYTQTYKNFSLREIVLGLPFNQEANKHTSHWVRGGEHHIKFMAEVRRNTPFLRFLDKQNLQNDLVSAFTTHMGKPQVKSSIKTISKKMIVLRCITFLNLPEKQRPPRLVRAVRGFLDGTVRAKRVSYKGTTLNSVFMIPSENGEGLLLAMDDSHFYFVETKMFKNTVLPDQTILSYKLIKYEPGLDTWFLSKLPYYQRYRGNNQYQPVTVRRVNPSPSNALFGDHFTINIRFEGAYSIEALADSFFDSYIQTYLENIDILITTPAEYKSEFHKKLAVEMINDLTSLLLPVIPLKGILNPKLSVFLTRIVPFTFSVSQIGILALLLHESDHPDDERIYKNEILLSFIGLALDLPYGVIPFKDAAKRNIDNIMHEFQKKLRRTEILNEEFLPSVSKEITTATVARPSSKRIDRKHKMLSISSHNDTTHNNSNSHAGGVDQAKLLDLKAKDILSLWSPSDAQSTSSPSQRSVITVYSEDDIYLEIMALQPNQTLAGTFASLYSCHDLEAIPSAKEMSVWWQQRDRRDLNGIGITSSDWLAKDMFDRGAIPSHYEALFSRIKQIETTDPIVLSDLAAKQNIFNELISLTHQWLEMNRTDGNSTLPKHQHTQFILYLSELYFRQKTIQTEFECKEALRAKRIQNRPIDIAIPNAMFPRMDNVTRRYPQAFYRKMFRGDLSQDLGKITAVTKEACINAIVEICKKYVLKLDFIRIQLRSKDGQETLHDIPRIEIGKTELAIYPLEVKGGLIGLSDLAELGLGWVVIRGNVGIMDIDDIKHIIHKKYYSFRLALSSFSDETKLLSLQNHEDKNTVTSLYHEPSNYTLSSVRGIDFSDPNFESVSLDIQGVFPMSQLASSITPPPSSGNVESTVRSKFYSQFDETMQPVSIDVPTTALPISIDQIFSQRTGQQLTSEHRDIWDESARIFKNELKALNIDTVICVDNSMTRNYYQKNYTLSKRFKTLLSDPSISSMRPIRYLNYNTIALPNKITTNRINKISLTKLAAAVMLVDKVMKRSNRKIALQGSARNENVALVRAGLMIKSNLTLQNSDRIFIFRSIRTKAGSVNAPDLIASVISSIRSATPLAFAHPRHINLLTQYAYKLAFELWEAESGV